MSDSIRATRNLDVSREALVRAFGPRAFESGLFYAHEPALRFELSRFGSPVELFTQAYDRAREILAHAFRDSRALVGVLVADETLPVRQLVLALRDFRLAEGGPRTTWTEAHEDELGAGALRFVSFALEREALNGLLWGALSGDLGIRPMLPGRVFVADPALGLLVHPYDDRGMDAIGPAHERLAALYHRFPDALLAYDLPRMATFFGAATARAPGGIVEAWQAALNRADADGVLVLSDPEIEIVGPRGVATGLDVLRRWLEGTRVTLEPRRTFARGDAVVVEQRGVWRSPEDGALVGEQDVASAFRVRGGRIAHYARFDTLDEALAHAGLRADDIL